MARRLRDPVRAAARRADGAAAVEFALALPILLALTLGVLDGGRALLALNTLEKLATEGARYASVRGSEFSVPATEPEVVGYLEAKAAGLKPDKLAVEVDWPSGNSPGEPVIVTVSYLLDSTFLPFQDFNFSRSSTLSIMR